MPHCTETFQTCRYTIFSIKMFCTQKDIDPAVFPSIFFLNPVIIDLCGGLFNHRQGHRIWHYISKHCDPCVTSMWLHCALKIVRFDAFFSVKCNLLLNIQPKQVLAHSKFVRFHLYSFLKLFLLFLLDLWLEYTSWGNIMGSTSIN